MRTLFISLACLVSLNGSVATATVADVSNFAYWICKNQAEVRTIRVQVDGGACLTYYTKLGAEKSVGTGKNTESCINFLNNIKTNLEKSNWTCRDATGARMTAGG